MMKKINLSVDAVRPEVMAAKITTSVSLSSAALEVALGYDGQHEVPRGSNRGPFVDRCLKAVGLNPGYPWCMAFVYLCIKEASERIGAQNTCVRTAGVLRCWNETPANRKILKQNATTANILPGYQFVLNYGKSKGHTGFVVAVHKDGSYTTIEGNTDETGSREGWKVCQRKRLLSDSKLMGFVVY